MDSPPLSPVTRALEQCLFGCAWVDSMHVVDFDVDEGHVLEWSSSASALTDDERYNLCFAAMPDSQPTSGGLGDLCFAFRFPREGARVPPLWGFSYFRAVRNEACKRGVFQKAVVLLTPLPLFRLFRSAPFHQQVLVWEKPNLQQEHIKHVWKPVTTHTKNLVCKKSTNQHRTGPYTIKL